MMKLSKPGITEEMHPANSGGIRAFLVKTIGTGFGTGYVPTAQGTVGSLLAVILWLIAVPRKWRSEILAVITLHLVSIPISGWGEKLWGKDPGRITIDEFAGQFIALAGIKKRTFSRIFLAFLLFRFFDVFKPRWVREHVETLPGGWGSLWMTPLPDFSPELHWHSSKNLF